MACTLAVTIAYSGAADNGDGTWSLTWTATPTGGTAPYAYLWAFTPADGVDPAVLNCPQGQTTQSVTLTLPLAAYAEAGVIPIAGQTPPTWLIASVNVTDSNFVAPPVVMFTSSTPTAGAGQSVSYAYSTSGATAVTIDGVTVATSGTGSFTPFSS